MRVSTCTEKHAFARVCCAPVCCARVRRARVCRAHLSSARSVVVVQAFVPELERQHWSRHRSDRLFHLVLGNVRIMIGAAIVTVRNAFGKLVYDVRRAERVRAEVAEMLGPPATEVAVVPRAFPLPCGTRVVSSLLLLEREFLYLLTSNETSPEKLQCICSKLTKKRDLNEALSTTNTSRSVF